MHWVSAAQAVQAEIRLYDHLFCKTNPEESEEGRDFLSNLNPNSLEVLSDCRLEPALAGAAPGSHFQFLRLGYFTADLRDHNSGKPVFNRSVTLRDTWAKIEKKGP